MTRVISFLSFFTQIRYKPLRASYVPEFCSYVEYVSFRVYRSDDKLCAVIESRNCISRRFKKYPLLLRIRNARARSVRDKNRPRILYRVRDPNPISVIARTPPTIGSDALLLHVPVFVALCNEFGATGEAHPTQVLSQPHLFCSVRVN